MACHGKIAAIKNIFPTGRGVALAAYHYFCDRLYLCRLSCLRGLYHQLSDPETSCRYTNDPPIIRERPRARGAILPWPPLSRGARYCDGKNSALPSLRGISAGHSHGASAGRWREYHLLLGARGGRGRLDLLPASLCS